MWYFYLRLRIKECWYTCLAVIKFYAINLFKHQIERKESTNYHELFWDNSCLNIIMICVKFLLDFKIFLSMNFLLTWLLCFLCVLMCCVLYVLRRVSIIQRYQYVINRNYFIARLQFLIFNLYFLNFLTFTSVSFVSIHFILFLDLYFFENLTRLISG